MNRFISATLACAFLFALTSVDAFGQALIIAGPEGRPAMVRDEAGNWSTPIRIYGDPDVEMFIPDITSAGWVSWHAAQFRQTGIYFVSLYSYCKNDHACKREMIPVGHSADPNWLQACAELHYRVQVLLVDTRKKSINITQTTLMNSDAMYHPEYFFPKSVTISLAAARDSLAKAVANISTIVMRESRNSGRGSTGLTTNH